jgi:beta-glucosidase
MPSAPRFVSRHGLAAPRPLAALITLPALLTLGVPLHAAAATTVPRAGKPVGAARPAAVPAARKAPSLGTPASEARITALLRQMTLEEKAGQLNQVSGGFAFGPDAQKLDEEAKIRAGQVGSMLNVFDPKRIKALQKIAVEESRLKIPVLFGLDVIHGFHTIFPVPLGLATSWDPALVEKVSRYSARETSAQGIRWTFSPMIDIARDARWGRMVEGAGEDPFLGSALARAYVRGYQGTRLDDPSSILACAKHYVAYGAVEAGRDYNTVDVPERTLRQIYLPPFQAAVDAGAATLMSAFNTIDGVPSTANPFTLDRILRQEWGFQGFVVSDYASLRETMVHGIANDEATAARKALTAGLGMDMATGIYLSQLPSLVKKGSVPLATLDDAVRRVLRLKMALGLFEHPYSDESTRPQGPEGTDLARTAAEESLVLLKNTPVNGAPVLPLVAAEGRTIALVGPHADDAVEMQGSWAFTGKPSDVVTLRSALAERAAREKMTLLYAKGTDVRGEDRSGFAQAVEAATKADVVVITLGEPAAATGEACSRTRLDLAPGQQALLEAVAATGKPVVLVLFNGRPLTINWAAREIPAIVEAWYPGQQAGTALAGVLFGDVSPSGRLTVSFPRSVGQEPLYYNALGTGRPAPPTVDLSKPPQGFADRWWSRYIDEQNAPLYPFGHGLSYTEFQYSPVTVGAKSISAAALERQGARLVVSADVRNTGKRAGTEVVQLYIRLRGTSIARPVRELRGFQRVTLAPGESKKVEFALTKTELAFWNIDTKNIVEPSALQVWVAPNSATGEPAEVAISD